MQPLTPKQKRKLEKLAKVLQSGDVAFIEHLFEIEENIEKLESKIPDLGSFLKSVKGKDGEDGYTPKKGKDYFDGENGQDYILTEKDKKDIAKRVEVPVVEKVVEKETIREVPIVTNNTVTEIVEKAVLDVNALPQYGVQFRDGLELLQGEERLGKSAIKGLDEAIDKVAKESTTKWWGGVGAIKGLIAGSNITIDDSNSQYPIITANLPAGSGITRSIVLTSGNTTMAATAATDYVYIVTGAHTMTLPTAVGNTNLYTVRNNHSANITVNTTSSQDIIGAVTATSYSIFSGDARSFISDGTSWNIV